MSAIEVEKLAALLDEDHGGKWQGDNALKGLLIISKYFYGKTVLEAAEHDVIYSVDAQQLIDAGLTWQDAEELAHYNWMVDSETGSLACYV